MSEANGTTTSSLKEQMKAVWKDIGRHQDNIDELYKGQNDNSRTNWQLLVAVAVFLLALFGGLWSLTISPINAELARIATEQRYRVKEIESLSVRIAVVEAKNDVQDKQIDVFRTLIRRVEDDKLGKDGFNHHLEVQLKDLSAIQRQLDLMNQKVDAIIPPQKTFEDILKRLGAIEQRKP